MNMSSPDAELLRRYAEQKDQAAFAEFVRQNLPLVYRCACRSLAGDAGRAEDVAQEVFVQVARKARPLSSHPALAAWLHTATRYAAADARRGEQRRQQRHEEARTMHEIEKDGPAEPRWDRLQPVIDEALASLKAPDREAVLLRFFAGKTHAEIGARLGLAEDAARMRVDRALEKLRAGLARHGIVSTGGALGAALAGQGALAVPAGLAGAITQAAFAASGATAGAGLLAAWFSTGGAKWIAGTSLAIALTGGAVALSRLVAPEAANPTSVSTDSPQSETPDGAWSTLIARWDSGTDGERAHLLRAVDAGELGARLLRLWRDNTYASRARFRSVFDQWCATSPEDAARWSAGTWDEITGQDGVKLREQAGFAWVEKAPRPAFDWALDLRDAAEETGLAARMLGRLAQTKPEEALAMAKEISDSFYQTARFGILEGWFTKDRSAAIDRLGDECVQHRRMPELLAGWAEADAHRFMNWGLNGQWSYAPDQTLRKTLRLRREACLDAVSKLPDPGKFVPVVFSAYLEKPPSTPPDEDAVALIQEADRVCMLGFTDWRDRNPAAAHKWLLGLPPDSPGTRSFLHLWGTSYVENADGRRNHAAQLDTLRLLPDSPAKAESMKEQIRKWTEHDAEAALAWVRGTGDESLTALVYESVTRGLVAESPDEAIKLYSALHDGPDKVAAALRLSADWAAKDHEAARRWLDRTRPAWPSAVLADDTTKRDPLARLLIPWAAAEPEVFVAWLAVHASDDAQSLRNVAWISDRLRMQDKPDAAAKLNAAYRAGKPWAELKPSAVAWLRASGKNWPGGLFSTNLLTKEEQAELILAASGRK